MQKNPIFRQDFYCGMPDAIRTHDLQSRSLTLYPAELRAHIKLLQISGAENFRPLKIVFNNLQGHLQARKSQYQRLCKGRHVLPA